MRLKTWLMFNEPHRCPSCNDLLKVPHMHEGIISRGDVMGWPKERRVLIHTPYNCVLICADCNLAGNGKYPPSREAVFEFKVARYGDDVYRWLRWLPFRVHPLRGWLG